MTTAVALAASFLPGLPPIEIDSELILTVILPPLLYSAALDVSWQSFRTSIKQIRRLGIFLVIVTALAVGLAAYTFEIQGEDGEGSRNLTRAVAALGLLAAAGGTLLLRRRLI